MRLLLSALALGVIVGAAAAGDFDQPTFAPGDSWIYSTSNLVKGQTHKEDDDLSIVRLQGDRMLIASKTVGSDRPARQRLITLDWSNHRSVDGQDTLVNRPLAFPLTLGKTWSVDYTESNPSPQVAREHQQITYKVVGWEDVTTEAGPFKALKIEGNGTWTAETPERVSQSGVSANVNGVLATQTGRSVTAAKRVTGRIYKVFYYEPKVKRWVKSTEDIYGANEDLTGSYSEELKAFHAAEGQ